MYQQKIDLNPYEVLILRLCRADMTAYDGFQWVRSGTISAPDFLPTAQCGHGLHGWLRGEGDSGSCEFIIDSNAVWIVAAVKQSEIIDLEGKVKFPSARVLYAGDRITATAMIKRQYPDAAVIGCVVSSGDHGTAIAGYMGAATAGHYGTATAGSQGTATAGDNGMIVLKYYDNDRYRIVAGNIGENGLLANVPYRLCPETHQFIKVSNVQTID